MLKTTLIAAMLFTPAPPDTGALRTFEVAPGEMMAVREMGGRGPVVVMVPGLLGSAYGFRKVAPQLVEAGARVVIVDPLGTGASGRPDKADYSLTAQAHRVAGVLDAMGIRRAVLMCHAVSASICYRLSLHRYDLTAGIVSINGGPSERISTPGLKAALVFAPLLKLFGGKGRARGKVRGGLRDSSGDPAWVTEEVVDGYVAPFDDLGDVLDMLKAMNNADEPELLAHRLDELRVPVYLLVGSSTGTSIRPDEIELLSDSVPDIEVDSVPGAGQYIHEEQPDVVAGAVMRMIVMTMPRALQTGASPEGQAVREPPTALDERRSNRLEPRARRRP